MMVFVFLFIFLVMVILIFLIHSASTLPSMNPFVKTNPVDRFLHSWVQFIKPVEMVRTAAHHTWRGRVGGFSSSRGLGLWFRWGVEWKNPNCVFIWGGGGIFGKTGEWEDSSGRSKTFSATSWGQQNTAFCEKKARTEQKTQKAPQNKPSLHSRLLTQSNPRPLRDSLFMCDGQDPPFCLRDIKQIQLRENNGGRGSLRVPQKQLMYNKHSYRKSKKSAPWIIPERKFQKQHSA